MTRPLIVVLIALAGAAAADQRYAIVVGANRGNVDEAPLSFAERDAERMARVLRRFGGVPAANLILVTGEGADAVEAAFSILEQRLRTEARAGDGEVMLIFYYSGHADGQALHLGGTELPHARLKEAAARTGAKLRVLIVDACFSGDLLRAKGATPAEPFTIDVDDRLQAEGTAIIASSSAGEDAHESERLRGGVFTHHFLVGLAGAADRSGDRRVSLTEAYQYGYAQTLRSTARARALQHPTYSLALEGRNDLVLTRLAEASDLGRLRFDGPGSYTVLAEDGHVVAELALEGAGTLMIDPGRYLVQLRTEALYQTHVVVAAGSTAVVETASLRATAPVRMVARGGVAGESAADAWSPGFFFSGALGSSVGYANGETEVYGQPVTCCMVAGSFQLAVEAGVIHSANLRYSFVGRVGWTPADAPDHEPFSQAVLGRLGARMGPTFSIHADLGAGVVRHRVALKDPPDGHQTDTIALGPFLAGGGLRWAWRIPGGLAVVLDLTTLAALPLGTEIADFGIVQDATLGLAVDL